MVSDEENWCFDFDQTKNLFPKGFLIINLTSILESNFTEYLYKRIDWYTTQKMQNIFLSICLLALVITKQHGNSIPIMSFFSLVFVLDMSENNLVLISSLLGDLVTQRKEGNVGKFKVGFYGVWKEVLLAICSICSFQHHHELNRM